MRQERVERPAGNVRILLMPLDIELAELTAGGMAEPKADWTTAAKNYLTEAVRADFATRDAMLVPYVPPADSGKAYRHEQIRKLHDAVATVIIRQRFDKEFTLPTKKDKFDWTLGEGAKTLREEYGADYALFVWVRDTYASGGRTLLSVVISILYVFPVFTGSGQQALASLVDLRSGDIVWFNILARSTGDLRRSEAARETVSQLLAKLPL